MACIAPVPHLTSEQPLLMFISMVRYLLYWLDFCCTTGRIIFRIDFIINSFWIPQALWSCETALCGSYLELTTASRKNSEVLHDCYVNIICVSICTELWKVAVRRSLENLCLRHFTAISNLGKALLNHHRKAERNTSIFLATLECFSHLLILGIFFKWNLLPGAWEIALDFTSINCTGIKPLIPHNKSFSISFQYAIAWQHAGENGNVIASQLHMGTPVGG